MAASAGRQQKREVAAARVRASRQRSLEAQQERRRGNVSASVRQRAAA